VEHQSSVIRHRGTSPKSIARLGAESSEGIDQAEIHSGPAPALMRDYECGDGDPQRQVLRLQRSLAFTLPDLEAHAMKSARLRSHTGREIHGIRRLRRGYALTASIANTSAGVFTLTAPQCAIRQSSLPESQTDGERRCDIIQCECSSVSLGRQITQRDLDLAPSG